MAAYDKSRPLVMDPTLVYATYFGSGCPYVQAVAVDSLGNVYIGGYVNQGCLPIVHAGGIVPVVNAVRPGVMGQQNAFVSKFDPTGKTVLYSTYLGGSILDQLNGIAVDSGGDLVGVGYTQSTDFPLANPAQANYTGNQSAFAFKLNAAGNGLVYSTYLAAGATYSAGNAVAVDALGNAYFTGIASSGFFQATPGALNSPSTFVVKLSNTGSEVYAAQIGSDWGSAIAVDTQGAAYVAGYSSQSSFPRNPPGARPNSAGGHHAFIAKLSPNASSLVWATFLGGSGIDSANAIALGNGNVVYVGGQTTSSDLPVTPGVVQRNYGGATDAFVASVSADGSQFGFVTYLGGARPDSLASLAVGSDGQLVVAGATYSRDFPVSAALQPVFPASPYSFFKSVDSGASFTPADNGLPGVSTGSILPDPYAAGTILVDTGQGIYRSADDGATWVEVEPNSAGSTVRSLSNPAVVYTIEACNFYKSSDGGQTWSSPYAGCISPGANVAGVSPSDPNTVLVFAGDTEYRSTDGGQTFPQVITTPMPLSAGTGGLIVASPDGSMYAATGQFGLYKSNDAGLTWNQLGSGVLPPNLSIALSTSSPSILYASDGSSVYKSMDAGATWNTVARGVGVTFFAVAPANPQTVYGVGAANHGVFVSTDGGVTWSPSPVFLDVSGLSGIVVSPTNPAEIYLGNYVPLSGFVAKLSADGTRLNWSTFYGPYFGLSAMGGAATAPSGDVWVAGTNAYGSLPLTPDARNSNAGAYGAAFLARIADATASCSYTINPTVQYLYAGGWQYAYFAGQSAFSVTAPTGCAWTATPSDSWIHLIRTSGTGSATIPLDVDVNNTANTRTGTVSVNGQVYTIVQPSSSCTYQLSNPRAGERWATATIAVTAPAGCPWDVELESSDPAAVTSPATGTGNGTVTISLPPNHGVNAEYYGVLIGGQYVYIVDPSHLQRPTRHSETPRKLE